MSSIDRNFQFDDGTTLFQSRIESEISQIVQAWNNHDQAISAWTKLKVSGTTTFNGATYTWPSALPGATSILQTTSGGTLSWVTSSGAYAPVASAFVTIGSDATLTSERSLTGTANQIVVTDNGAGSTVVLSTPQNIHTGASPTFVGGTFTGTLDGQGQLKGKGTTTNDDAAAGYIGEAIRSNVVGGSAVSSTGTTQWFDVTSITLTAGDWDIDGILTFLPSGATVTNNSIGISSTSGNSATGLINGDNQIEVLPTTAAASMSANINGYRASISGSTTFYLKANITYTISTAKSFGRISARRRR